MKPTKQTVYLPVKEDYGIYLGTFLGYPDGYSNEGNLQKQEGYFFTKEQLNEYTANVIKQALETAVNNVQTIVEPHWSGEGESTYVDRESITNTFEETFKQFKV